MSTNTHIKRIIIIFILAAIISLVMFFIKEKPFEIIQKEKTPKTIEDHHHEPGTPEEHEH